MEIGIYVVVKTSPETKTIETLQTLKEWPGTKLLPLGQTECISVLRSI